MLRKKIMNKPELELNIQNAISSFLERESDLLMVSANERSITFKFGEILQSLFPNWTVDCEYNRDGYDPKIIQVPVENITSDDTKAKTIFPDIIIHHRNLSGMKNNLLIIEAKKDATKSEIGRDCEKIKIIMSQLGYQYGVFLNFHTNSPFNIEYRFIDLN